jgi:riboflavin kinase / FMN adenylyltransferase
MCSISPAICTAALIEVEFVAKLRDEAKFDSLDAMVAQMQVDAAQARELLSKVDGG